MIIEGLKVSILTEADRSDPTNQLVVACARAKVDGVPCGWKGAAFQVVDGQAKAIELAVAHLIKQIMTKPQNAIVIGAVPPSPAIAFEVPEVVV